MRFVALLTVLLLLPITAASQADDVQIAFGTRHAIALRNNGEVVTWGNNVGCQLGRRAGNSCGEPGLVLRNAVQVAAASEALAGGWPGGTRDQRQTRSRFPEL